MSWHRTSRKYHKWLMLFIGVQFVIWAFSGAYMVLMDIDYIHGDSLVAKSELKLAPEQVSYSFQQLLSDNPEAENIILSLMLDKAVYRFTVDKNSQLVSAEDGKQQSPISEALAVSIAKHHYKNKVAKVKQVKLLVESAPRELSIRRLPAWRIDFDDFASPTFYISVNSGELVTKRHSFWRFFDWMFAFHVMDYVDEASDNKLLLVFTLLAILASIFGLILTYFRTIKVNGKLKAKRKAKPSQKFRKSLSSAKVLKGEHCD